MKNELEASIKSIIPNVKIIEIVGDAELSIVRFKVRCSRYSFHIQNGFLVVGNYKHPHMIIAKYRISMSGNGLKFNKGQYGVFFSNIMQLLAISRQYNASISVLA